MDWKLFWTILGTGIALVVVQGIASWFDGFLTQAQMRSRGITNGYSFVEHGGMWADVFVISPMVAYAASKYQLHYFSQSGLAILFAALVVAVVMGYLYRKGALTAPEAYTHDDKTTLAGWLHGLYAVAAIWICALFYLNLATPGVSPKDIIVFSLILTPFFYLGVAKFNERWTFDAFAKRQVTIGTIAVWLVAALRLWRS